ncbi:rsmB, RAS family GTPase [Dictyostelium purpureum]|uniref:RsmB, RAS family GTPase n=1 Tax=Dictyostelium purpureum TaxID=5786 RepID=F0ZLH0_DICPU|nr:rsmB, RAS family GTPase [Dictyostelium purpureum]EGC35221.1 rsmB, RAS family GTPase [Dictyostelium purpureum]|eukprot:XP_003288259.1 rsmB, RAS family GTPase [Dictyostelium purpureum]
MLNNKNCPIILLGDSGVGKSSITLKFIRDTFEDVYNPTFENSYIAELDINYGEKIRLEILDTAGQEDFINLRDHYARIGEAFILVYSITCRGSFNEMKHIKENITNIKQCTDVPMILVGNKVDLSNTERKVSIEEGKSLARSFGCAFIETSAKENINIEETFKTLVNDWKKSKERKVNKNGTLRKTSGYAIKNLTLGRKKNIIVGDNEFYENFEKMNNSTFHSSNRSNSSNSVLNYNNNNSNNINNKENLKHYNSSNNINNQNYKKHSDSKVGKSKCFLQ